MRPGVKRALSCKNLWDGLPRGARRVLGRSLQIIPASILLGRRFRATRRLAQAAERWTSDAARAHQIERLRSICAVAARTGFYREVFRRCGFSPRDLQRPEDLAVLPTIDRGTLRDHLTEMRAAGRRFMAVDYVSTGGTGGAPLQFYIGADRSPVEYAHLVTSWERCGYRLGTPMAVFRGRVVAAARDGLRHDYDPILRHHYYSNFHMTDDDMRRYLTHVATIGPCFLHAYPSAVFALARFCRRAGVEPPRNIRGVIAESEIVYPEQRAFVEEVFGVRYFSCYGHTEKLVLAAECEHSTDYHVWPTYGYFELLDEQGAAVTTSGRRGEIVGTGFINTVVPFIRYRTGDYATYVGDHCEACGRRHTIIRDVRGHRTQEVLVAADGSQISWTALNMHDDTFARVRQFQFHQDTPGRAVLRVVPADGFGEDDVRRIRQNLGRKLDGRVEFSVERAEAIPLTRRGKMVYVDQRIAEVGDPRDVATDRHNAR